MKKKRKRIIWTIVLVFIIYFFLPVPFITKHQELSIQEKAFHFLYDREDYGPKERVKTLYIDIGEGGLLATFFDIKENGSVFELKSPSPQVIKALSDLPVEVKLGSEFKPTEVDGMIPVLNEQGDSAVLLGVAPIIKSLGLARCRTYYNCGPLCSAEYESFFIWTPLGWKHFFSFPYMKS